MCLFWTAVTALGNTTASQPAQKFLVSYRSYSLIDTNELSF
jgi:hypothetical protein